MIEMPNVGRAYSRGVCRSVLAMGVAGWAMAVASADAAPTKNIILMIADGAGYNTLDATRFYTGAPLAVDSPEWTGVAQSVHPLRTENTPGSLAQDPHTLYDSAKAWNTTPVPGNSTVPGFESYPAGFEGYEWSRETYPDSGDTMTSMATGIKTYNNAINVDGAGIPRISLAEVAKSEDKATGVIATVQFGDATPSAGGGAHNVARSNRTEIAYEMFGAGVLDVIAGTGNPDYDNNGNLRTTPDNTWMPADLWSDLKNGTNTSGANDQDWQLTQERSVVQQYASGALDTPDKLAMITKSFDGQQAYRGPDGLVASPDLPYADPMRTDVPTLSELTTAALNRLNKDPDGFYLAVEQGEPDRAMHANNMGRMIEAYIEFDQAVSDVIDWINSPNSQATMDNTLVIATADHDHHLYGPDGETIPFQDLIDNGPGNLPGYAWFGPSHSNNLVPLFGWGAGSDDLLLLADQIDTYTDEQGRTFGRGAYTDQAELGRYLISTQVPEPSSLGVMLVGLLGVAGAAARRSTRRPTQCSPTLPGSPA